MLEATKRASYARGIYYPEDMGKLDSFISDSLEKYSVKKQGDPLAIVSPVGNYLYSEKAYAYSYSQLSGEECDTAVIIAPLHKMSFYGIGLTGASSYECPFGDFEVDTEAAEQLHNYNEDFITYQDDFHESEHSIEVQLPYISKCLGNNVKILPIIIGETNTRFTLMLSKALQQLIEKGDKKYRFILTTNLSSGLSHEEASKVDKLFIDTLRTMNPNFLSEQLSLKKVMAHGGGGIITILRLVNLLKLDTRVRVLHYNTSMDTHEDNSKVEGYLSAAIVT